MKKKPTETDLLHRFKLQEGKKMHWISVEDLLPNHDSAVWVRDAIAISVGAYDPKKEEWLQLYHQITVEYWYPADQEAEEIYREARRIWEQCK
jgi:hypothetical protein